MMASIFLSFPIQITPRIICILIVSDVLIAQNALIRCIKETRHEIDVIVTVDVTAHNFIEVCECPLHGGAKTGSFPETIKATVQYGKNLQALVVAFNTVGAVSIHRTHEILPIISSPNSLIFGLFSLNVYLKTRA